MWFVDLATKAPMTAFIMICAIYYLLKYIVHRSTRAFQVARHGWPPKHLDADGDWKPAPEKEEREPTP